MTVSFELLPLFNMSDSSFMRQNTNNVPFLPDLRATTQSTHDNAAVSHDNYDCFLDGHHMSCS